MTKLRLVSPTPGLQSLQGAYSRNILRLEETAEEMSADGSDLGEEIRRINSEQKEMSRSRENSIQSSHQGEIDVVKRGPSYRVGSGDSRSRTGSGSIVDVNGAARWGGYSPGGYFNSPVGSVRSGGSGSNMDMNRKASASGSSRLAQMVEPTQEGRPLDSPLAQSHSSLHSQENEEHTVERQPSQSSFAKRYDQIAGQIEDSLAEVPPSPPKHASGLLDKSVLDGSLDHFTSRPVTPPLRPRSADTFQEAQVAFKDFDGVHFSPGTEEFVELDADGNEVRRVSARRSSGAFSLGAASMLRTPHDARPISYAEPPPADGMVYYPAPVPRMLNLPKRLSQLPAASVQAKRRTQVLSQLPDEARHSAYWIPPIAVGSDSATQRSHRSQGSGSIRSGSGGQHSSDQQPRGMLNERMSIANLNNLPPQLRASIYFDHQSVGQEVEVKSESAVATLDSILAASATAPVSAFTDHPFAGDVRRSVFAPEQVAKRRSTAPLAQQARNAPASAEAEEKKMKRRSSSIGRLLRRNSSGNDLAEQLSRNGSRLSLMTDGGRKLQKRRSQMSIAAGDELDRQSYAVRTPGNEISEMDFAEGGLIGRVQNPEVEQEGETSMSRSRPVTAMSGSRQLEEGDAIEDDFKEAEAGEDVEEPDPVYAAPSTLLAELQIRKAAQKKRGKTAATSFPQGMHSTLLQLDAVEQINKEKRKKHKVALTWEGETYDADGAEQDEDVPLGMLFPSKHGQTPRNVGDGKDWDRPLGLMERREMEDNEPLASRRNRMLGLPPSHGREQIADQRATTMPNMSDTHLAGQPDAPPEGQEEDEAAVETLGHRLRRLRTKDALDTAISDVAPKPGSRPVSTFTDDVLSQFGGLDGAEGKGKGKAPEIRDSRESQPAEAGAQEEETLGQRRARLQREREEQPTTTTERPPIISSNSMGHLLAENPTGTRKSSKNYEPSQGTLLHASASAQARQKQQIRNTNVRSSSYGLDKPVVSSRPQNQQREHTVRSALPGMPHPGMALAPGVYNNGVGAQTTPAFGVNGQSGYFASPTAMPPAGRVVYPQTYQPTYQHNPLAYQALTGSPAHMGAFGFPNMGIPGYGYGTPQQMSYAQMGFGMEEPLDPKQRAAIDRWRASVMQ